MPCLIAAAGPTGKVTKDPVPFLDLAAGTLTELGNKVPEKWEGLAIGPRLKDGSYVLVTGTDNDYSVTQNATGQQFDAYFRVSDADPYPGSIQCPLGLTRGCFTTADVADGIINQLIDLPNDGSYELLPGVLMPIKSQQPTSATSSDLAVTTIGMRTMTRRMTTRSSLKQGHPLDT